MTPSENVQSLMNEFRPLASDNPRVALAKAGARACIQQCGIVRSQKAIAMARALAAGLDYSAAAGTASYYRGHVLASATRGRPSA